MPFTLPYFYSLRPLLAVFVLPSLACVIQWYLGAAGQSFTWFFFWVAMFLSTQIGNKYEGILGTLMAALLVWWFFVPEPYTFAKSQKVLYAYEALFIAFGVLASLFQDRLQRKNVQVSRQLTHLEEIHQSLLDSLADGVFVAQDFKFVFCNPVMPEILGYRAEEFVGLTFDQVLAPEFLTLWTSRFEQRIAEGTEPLKYYEVQFLNQAGERIWVELHASRAYFNGRPAVLGIIHDITERKKDLELLRLANTVFENTQEALVVTDLKGTILAANPAFSIITEYSNQELIGKSMNILCSGRHDRDFYRQMWRSLQQTGSWQGPIWNRRKSGDIYQEWLTINTVRDENGVPIQYVGISLDISRISHVETFMEHMAHHDNLTGLPNRLLLDLRLKHTLESARREQGQCAVLFLDLDGFKDVNDTWGHKAGDELLQQVAARLKERLRDIDTIARLGGDEFVVVLDEIFHSQEAESLAQDLIDRLSMPYQLQDGHEVSIGCSIGIALFPHHGDSAEALLKNADAYLYMAKSAGKQTWRICKEPD